MQLTPISVFDGWWAKREDLACYQGDELSSGSKVRQYFAMATKWPGAPMLVGCSADSAMQIYIAEASRHFNVPGIVFVPARQRQTEATTYAVSLGVELHEVRPGWLSVCRARAKAFGATLGRYVKWDPAHAVRDAMVQTQNLPQHTARVVVATGSGLTAAGVLAGLAEQGREVPVVAVASSVMADADKINSIASKYTDKPLPPLTLERISTAYSVPVDAVLPDGDRLDPYYAAKVLGYIKPGDCFWIPGRRASGAMPQFGRKH